jgi:hypothetical protein
MHNEIDLTRIIHLVMFKVEIFRLTSTVGFLMEFSYHI